MKAMIFAAGLGTRLKPLTDRIPKALVPVQGKPLLEHLILKLKASGFNELVINVHHFPEQIIGFLKRQDNFGLHIDISDERDMLLETGGGLLKARRFFTDEPFLAHNVDILSNLDLKAVMAAHMENSLATVVVSQRQTARYLLFDQDNRLQGWQNIQTGETKPQGLNTSGLHALAFSGIQVISPDIFDCMKDMPPKFSMIDLYLKCCATHNIRAYIPADYRMLDVGKISTIQDAENFLAEKPIR